MNFNFIKVRFSSLSDLLLSNIFANIILFLGVYIVTRFISDSEFGKYSLFVAIALAMQHFFTLRYEHAIPAAISDRTANILFLFCIIFNIFLSISGFTLTYITFYLGFLSLLGEGDFVDIILMIWPACFALALYSTMQTTALRAGVLRKLAVSRVVRAVLLVAAQVAIVILLTRSAQSLIAGEVIANIVISIILFYIIWPDLSAILYSKGTYRSVSSIYKNIISAIKRFRVFALVGLPHAFAHQASTALYAGLLGAFYGPAALGQFYLMRRMIFGVTTLFSTATYQLGVSEASAAKGNRARLMELYKYVIVVIGVITIPAALLMLGMGQLVFSTVFGDEWGVAGDLARATFLLIAVEPIASAIAFIPLFLQRQAEAFLWSIGQNAAGLLSLVVIFSAGGDLATALLWSSLAVSTVLIAYLIRLFRLCHNYAHAEY